MTPFSQFACMTHGDAISPFFVEKIKKIFGKEEEEPNSSYQINSRKIFWVLSFMTLTVPLDTRGYQCVGENFMDCSSNKTYNVCGML
jgi:hypothetical protein